MDGNVTRDILDRDGNVIGALTLPEGTSEDVWTAKLAPYAAAPPSPPSAVVIVTNSIMAAIAFGQAVLVRYAAENVLLGITAAGKTDTVRRALAEVITCLQTGSLYNAMDQLRAVPAENKDATFITDARLLTCVNSIETYLHLALSTTL